VGSEDKSASISRERDYISFIVDVVFGLRLGRFGLFDGFFYPSLFDERDALAVPEFLMFVRDSPVISF